ncbi:MAG: MG2 domain-containing protein [Elusimicrobiota bacterium]
MATRNRQSKLCRRLSLLVSVALGLSGGLSAGDLSPSRYSLFTGGRFFLLTDSSFSSREEAVVRLEAPGRRHAFEGYSGVDIVVYRVPQPVKFLRKQKNLHRPEVKGNYAGEGLANAMSYIWDSWYKKSRLAWQRIFAYGIRKRVIEESPGLRQAPPHSYETRFENNPQFGKVGDFELVTRFRYPIWHSKPIGPPKGVVLGGSSSNFIKPKQGNVYIPIGRRGPGLYYVEAIVGQYRANTLVFVSDTVGVTKMSRGQQLVWTVDKLTGEPREKTRIILSDGVGVIKSGVTDQAGVLVLSKESPERSYIIGEDTDGGIFISENFYYDSEIYAAKVYSFTDRPLYRPGDEVKLKVLGRMFESADRSEPLKPGKVRVVVLDPNRTPLIVKSMELEDPVAGGDTSFRLPKFAAAGGYSIELTYEGDVYAGAFRVSRYAKPHFEIDIVLDKSEFKTGEPIKGRLRLTYPGGEPVRDARVDLNVRAQKLSMVAGELNYLGRFPVELVKSEFQASGQGVVDFELPAAPSPSRYVLRVRGVDGTSYRVTATKEILIEAGIAAFEVSTDRNLTKPGKKVVFTVGSRTPGTARAEGGPESWEAIRLEDRSTSSGPVTDGKCAVVFEKSGSYSVHVKDSRGNIVGSADHWVEGPELRSTPGSVSIILDKETYRPGDDATALITFSEKVDHALVTMERDEVASHALMPKGSGRVSFKRMSDHQWRARIPIRKEYSPNITMSVAYVLNGRYVFQNKGIQIDIPSIDIAFRPDKKEYKPGETVHVEVTTTLEGKPLPASVAVSVVDEMIYVLQAEIAPNILDFFYHLRRNQVKTSSSLDFFTYDSASWGAGPPGSSPGGDYHRRRLKLRERPRREDVDTALWLPSLRTDSSGKARFSFKMPDSLTRWRITGRAVSERGIVGQRKAYVVSRKDHYLKWTGPVVFRYGAKPMISMVAFNLTDGSRELEFRASGLGMRGRRTLSLHPGANHIALGLSARKSGSVKTSLHSKGAVIDALETSVSLVPRRWLTTRTSEVPLASRKSAIDIPANAFNVRLSVANGVSQLFLAMADRLIAYPYGCVEQTASRLIPLSMAVEHSGELGLSPQTMARLEDLMVDNRARLVRMAGPDAVFGWWGNMTEGSAFMTAYAYYADWRVGKVTGRELPAEHWSNLLEVYSKGSGGEDVFGDAVVLFLAGEMGLPTRTLLTGVMERALELSPSALYRGAALHADMRDSYVLSGYNSKLRKSLGVYLTKIAMGAQGMVIPRRFGILAGAAQAGLEESRLPIARAMLLLGKAGERSSGGSISRAMNFLGVSRKGRGDDDRSEVREVLFDMGSEVPTVDRSLGLIFLSKALDVTRSSAKPVRIKPGGDWREEKTGLGRSGWLYRGRLGAKAEVELESEPPKGLKAHVIYDSFASEPHALPLRISRDLYRLEPSGNALEFQARRVGPGWRVDTSDIYLDEVRVTPGTGSLYRFGVVEVPLPAGSEVDESAWGLKIRGLPGHAGLYEMEGARHAPGELRYSIPIERLEKPFVIRHLVRFSQAGTFQVPRARFYRMYAPQQKAFAGGNSPEFKTIVVR